MLIVGFMSRGRDEAPIVAEALGPDPQQKSCSPSIGIQWFSDTEFLINELTVSSDRGTVQHYGLSSNASAQSDQKEKSFFFHHDDVRPHYCGQTQGIKGKLKFIVVPQPPFSPDLTPSDFWLFPKLKTLKGQHFSTDAEVQAAVRKWILSQPESFYVDRMKNWIERLNKSEAVSGDYVEK
ncbi:uncharacterized protein TNCV_5136131 [Trichonephila clavipes]|nr:uncharacterized protein TNCV_5136131 [Trichonephila clavipes]